MGLLDIRDDPDYINANQATKQAIFDQYSKDDPDYVNANSATQAAIRQEFGLSGPSITKQSEPSPVAPVAPQAVSVGGKLVQELGPVVAEPLKDVAGTAFNVGKKIIEYPIETAKNVATWTPRSILEVASHPQIAVQQYLENHPLMSSNASLKSLTGDAMEYARGLGSKIPSLRSLGSTMVQGAVAPESLFAAPYQMAGYEQEKIRANPTAPEYQTNPYAQAYRGEYATQGAAGAANRRNAIASQQYGGLTQEEQDILEQDRIAREIRRKAAERVLGPVAPR